MRKMGKRKRFEEGEAKEGDSWEKEQKGNAD